MGSVWPATWPPAAEELHIFDPKGDVLLVLLRHSIDSMMDELDSEDEMSIVTNGDVEGENVEENGEEKKLDLQGLKKDLELDCVSGECMEYRYTDDNESDGMSQASSHQPSVHTNVHLRVSSRHLALASTIFCGMLDSGCKEASMLQMNGSVVIPLPEDDPDALIILLDIIHGKTRRVPHYLGFGQLIKLASLIDYYQILEAVDMWFDVWLFDFDFEIGDSCQEPGKYVHGIAMKHLWLSWVFRKSNEFSTITRALQHLGEVDAEWEEVYGVDSELEQEEADKLPIPQTILDAIQSRRDKAKSDAIGVIHNLISQYSGPGFMCTNRHYCEAKKTACDATVLGSLIRGASQLQILPARKEYEGSFSRLIKEIKGIKIFTTCNLIEGYANDNDIHRIQASIDVKLTEISNNLIGLQLIDFISSHSSSVSI